MKNRTMPSGTWRWRRLVVILALTCLLLSAAQAQSIQTQSDAPGCHSKPDTTEPNKAALHSSSPLPDTLLVDQDGRAVRFYTDLLKNKVVAINFIFTTCTTVCPPMGANFARLRSLMKDRLPRDLHLISISVDPATDTPERLKAWANKFGGGPGWTLLTGPKHDVDDLLKKLQVFTSDKWDHSPLVMIGSEADGKWTRSYGLAPPSKLAEIINGLLTGRATAQSTGGQQ